MTTDKKTAKEIISKYKQAQSEFDSIVKYTLGDVLLMLEEALSPPPPIQEAGEVTEAVCPECNGKTIRINQYEICTGFGCAWHGKTDHIPDTSKLVKTMSVECHHPFTKTEDGKTFCADCNEPIQLSQMSVELPSDEQIQLASYEEKPDSKREAELFVSGAQWLRDKIKSQLSTPPAPLTIEEAKQKIARKYKFDSWNLLFNKRVGMPFELIEDDFNEVIKLYAQSQQPK